MHVWFETQNFEDKQVIRAWCQNNTSSPLHLKYEAEFIFQEKKETQSGSLLALPNEPVIFSKASFIFPTAEFDTVRLLVFHKKELLLEKLHLRVQTDQETKEKPLSQNQIPPSSTLEQPVKKSAFDAEIDGLILDETRSKLAHDFYELFYNYWSAENVSTGGNTLVIREMPAQIGIGSQVVVEIDGRRLTTLNLQPRGEVVENLAKQLTAALVKHFNDPNNFMDIDSDDLNGSGIY